MRRIIILGSTGSIGTQALEVISENPQLFQVVGLAAGTNAELLESQRLAFGLSAEVCVLGAEAATELVTRLDAEVVVNGITGSIGLAPTLGFPALDLSSGLRRKETPGLRHPFRLPVKCPILRHRKRSLFRSQKLWIESSQRPGIQRTCQFTILPLRQVDGAPMAFRLSQAG